MSELVSFLESTGILNIDWRDAIMLMVGLVLVFLAITKQWEPYELLPIGLGILIVNLPLTGVAISPSEAGGTQGAGIFGVIFHYGLSFWNILPPVIFLGIGALTDFGPLISNPKTLLLGAAAQIGIFVAFWGALGLNFVAADTFSLGEAASIGIIGGADGLSDTLREKADCLLSLGHFTWPHLLARVLLMEQLYRAQQILSHHPYHRE